MSFMELQAAVSVVLIAAGVVFFGAGSVGLLRLPDLLSRLHALTKADNVGLGLVAMGLVLQADGAFEVLRLLLVWVLAMFSSSVTCYLVANSALGANLTSSTGPGRPGVPP